MTYFHLVDKLQCQQITYVAILYIKQSKSLVPGLCRATEQLLSVILNISKYLTHTEIFFLNTRLYLLPTRWTTQCTEKLNCRQFYKRLQESSSLMTIRKLDIDKITAKIKAAFKAKAE